MRTCIRYSLLALFLLVVRCVFAGDSALVLTKATAVNSKTIADLAANSDAYAAIDDVLTKAGVYDVATLDAFTNINNGDVYYALLSDMTLHSINVPTNVYVAGWQVVRWGGEYIEPGFLNRTNAYHSGMSLGWSEYDINDSLGCLGAYPLRYGDVDGDGNNELVLFLSDDMLIFSLSKHSVVFSAQLKLDDWLDVAETQSFNAQYGAGKTVLPQYQSRIVDESIGVPSPVPGQRGYAKLYFGDFNGDGKFDILEWRKFYVSLLSTDSEKGFKLVSNTFIHYSLENGVYVKENTSETDIKAWLAAKGLTWQDGYPNVSECPGEEGKPIPETVDPLLNDPDVLQTSTTSSGAISP